LSAHNVLILWFLVETEMRDLDLAKQRLNEKNLSLVIVKNGKLLFETSSPGIRGFLSAIEEVGEDLSKSSVADKIAGRAVALLCAYSHVNEVFAVVLSKEALKVLREHNIKHEYEKLVSNILNAKGTDMCPFEKYALKIRDSTEAYEKLKRFATLLSEKTRTFIEENTPSEVS